ARFDAFNVDRPGLGVQELGALKSLARKCVRVGYAAFKRVIGVDDDSIAGPHISYGLAVRAEYVAVGLRTYLDHRTLLHTPDPSSFSDWRNCRDCDSLMFIKRE